LVSLAMNIVCTFAHLAKRRKEELESIVGAKVEIDLKTPALQLLDSVEKTLKEAYDSVEDLYKRSNNLYSVVNELAYHESLAVSEGAEEFLNRFHNKLDTVCETLYEMSKELYKELGEFKKVRQKIEAI